MWSAHVDSAWKKLSARARQWSASSEEWQAHCELVAAGLTATLSVADMATLVTATDGSLAQLLQRTVTTSYTARMRECQFVLVVLAEVVQQLLDAATDEASVEAVRSACPALQELVQTQLLPLVHHRKFQVLQPVALTMIKNIVAGIQALEAETAIVQELGGHVHDMLMAAATEDRDDQDTHEHDDDEAFARDQRVSYLSLCNLLSFLLQDSLDGAMLVQSKAICLRAIELFAQSPRFLHAVSVHLVPSVLKLEPAAIKEFAQAAIGAWQQQIERAECVNVLYLLIVLLPRDPTLIEERGLQQLIAYALGHQDSLLRKQGMHLLKIALSHYINLFLHDVGEAQRLPAVLDTWQNFLTASEVIQMHHEPHLIEQVWPQVEHILQTSLVVVASADKTDASAATSKIWPIAFSFEWVESLLLRVFAHENPVVRRMYLSNFMEACLKRWNEVYNAKESTTGTRAWPEVDGRNSFACQASFQTFLFRHLFSACNDPLMYRSSRKEAFQKLMTEFLATFLTFRVEWNATAISRGDATDDMAGLLDTFGEDVHQAIFGSGVECHSPEALISMLEIFQDWRLQTSLKALEPSSRPYLAADALETLRFMVQVHVLRSFPQPMRIRALRSLRHALACGFTDLRQLPLGMLGRVLSVFPTSNLMANNAEAFASIHEWLHSYDGHFTAHLREALMNSLSPSSDGKELSSPVLARLMLFVCDCARSDSAKRVIVYEQPVSKLIPSLEAASQAEALQTASPAKLIRLLGHFEEEIEQIGEYVRSLMEVRATNPEVAQETETFTFSVRPLEVYSSQNGWFSCVSLFNLARDHASQWIGASTVADAANRMDDDDTEEYFNEQDAVLSAAARVATQTATYLMQVDGDLQYMYELDDVCKMITKNLDDANISAVQHQTLALHFLSLVSNQPEAIEAISAFTSEAILPLMLKSVINRRDFSNGSRTLGRCLALFQDSKWLLTHNVLSASRYVPTTLLKQIFDQCLDALPAAGTEPREIYYMVQVLSMALSQLALEFVTDEDRLNELFQTVWGAYMDCKPKTDLLTRAVVYCMFQPAFLLSESLSSGKNAIVKRWYRTFFKFGEVHRPNVVFHVTCRMCQIWRAHPTSTWFFMDEIVELVLYKEPVIVDEKKQFSADDFENPPTEKQRENALAGRHKFVRLVLLSFLDELLVDQTRPESNEVLLMNELIVRLLKMNFEEEWMKQHMLHSEGFGKKQRCWQALCVLSKHITHSNIALVNPLLWKAFASPNLTSVRFYMEVVAMRAVIRFPSETIEVYVVPMMKNYNLMPQIAVSLLFVCGYAVQNRLGGLMDEEDNKICRMLVDSMLPWLNSSHGHTRVLVQYLVGMLLPPYLHKANLAASDDMSTKFVRQMASFLCENKDCKRMYRRQTYQLSNFRPEYESSMLGLLTSAKFNEFLELFPKESAVSFTVQLKDTMNELYAQFQREHFSDDMASKLAHKKSQEDGSAQATDGMNASLNVQRKIDTSAILLDESVLPVAMRERTELDLNIRQKKRQQIIMCATLVDKTPNLAGLARTCEIFNAQKLILPNIRVCDEEMFGTISVTANKWINMEEVRPDGLVAALQRWKEEGYVIVAVEQTASSVCLSEYQFPEKMVIVLGKEKEGIPVDVLQMVDVCVEIPQFGIIRSLNVHVSGAILLWEYTQQQMLRRAALPSTA
ncbi:TPA: hypothetical protein N0F65_007560 [Lagenidium giganteum]|uniref:tRNA (guanosine(18)-2'-O)-methyltransferase TARBP1 n=1 Tax=Lagenidium giganteum TaxID=4803 RepID=A0AAV2ZD59_9STRA|nr:TPA: hypothetical protein N0F65_007560 [Lagenidium giganteum]